MSQTFRLSMGGCRHCKTVLYRDMSDQRLRHHFEGRCADDELHEMGIPEGLDRETEASH